MLGAPPQGADRVPEVAGEGAQATAWQVGEEPERDLVRAHDVERGRVAGEPREERALEPREVRHRRRGRDREHARVSHELTPRVLDGNAPCEQIVGDARDPRHAARHALAFREPNEARARGDRRARHRARGRERPTELDDMPSRRRERRLAIDDEHRERGKH